MENRRVEDRVTALRSWREKLLNIFIPFAAIAATIMLFFDIKATISRHQGSVTTLIYAVMTIITILMAIFRKVNLKIRAWSVLLVPYIVGVTSMVSFGLGSSGRVYLLILPIGALILIGVNSAIAMSTISVATFLAFSILARTQILSVTLVAERNSLLAADWLAEGVEQAVLTLIIMYLGVKFYQFMENLIEREQQTRMELLGSRQKLSDQNLTLEQKVAERTTALEKSNRILDVQYRLAEIATSAHNIHDFFAQAHGLVRNLVKTENFFVALLEETTGMLSFPYFVDEKQAPITDAVPLADFRGLTGYIIRTGEHIHHGTDQYSELLRQGEIDLIGQMNEDIIALPLKEDGRNMGAICIQSYTPGVVFSDEDEDILAAIARHISSALIRYQALEAERQRKAELDIINSIQTGLTNELEIQQIIDLVGDKCLEVFETPTLAISLMDSEGLVHYHYLFEEGRRLQLDPVLPNKGGVIDRLIKSRETGCLIYGSKYTSEGKVVPGTGKSTKTGLAKAIYSSNNFMGAIQLESGQEEHYYSLAEQSLLSTIAAAMGTAVDKKQIADERNRAIEALRESEELFRKIVISLTQYISIWGLDMKCRYVSPAVEKLTGYTPEERLAMPLSNFLQPDSICSLKDELTNALLQENSSERDLNRTLNIDLVETRKDGSRVVLQSTFIFLRDVDGRPTGILGISTDVTEKKKLEEQRNEAVLALRQSEEHYRLLAENIDDVIWTTDTRYELLYVSPSIFKLRGIEPEEAVSESIQQAMTADSARLLLEEYERVRPDIENGSDITVQLEIEYYRIDGSTVWVDLLRKPLRDNAGNLTGYLGVFHDISARKQAQRELQQKNSQLGLAMEIANLASWEIDDRRTGFIVNDQLYALHRTTAGQEGGYVIPIEVYIRKFVHPDDEADVRELLKKILSPGSNLCYSELLLKVICRGGEIRNHMVRVNIQRGPRGKIIKVSGINQDITELVKTEGALRESERRMAKIIDFLPIATFVIDADGVVTSWNREMEKLTGVPAKDMIGKGNHEYAIAFYGTRIPILIDYAFLTDQELSDRYSHINQANGILTAEAFCPKLQEGKTLVGYASRLFGADGKLTGAIESIRDVTDIRKTEGELVEARDSAQAANRSKSTFLANMSHEIRTPMNAILGFTQLALRDSGLSGKLREQLEIINNSGEHLLALINDILEISKIEAGKMTFIPSSFNLHQLLKDIEIMFRMKTGEKKLQLVLDIAKNLPEWVETDQGKLRQILINLIGNAVKFTEEGGVAIRAKMLSAGHGKKNLVIEIEDTGPGIPEEEQENLFKVFMQTSSGEKAGGTGLGLVISQNYIHMMGGSISVMSTPGKGSIFRFSIPYHQGEEGVVSHKQAHRKVLQLLPGEKAFKVLIADDRETNRKLLDRMLTGVGFVVREAENGATALEVFRDWKPDIILMDMEMPVMNGMEAMQMIKNDPKGRKTVVIAVTASAFQDDRERILKAGADGYLSKPFKENDLYETIGELCGVKYRYADNPTGVSATVKDEGAGEEIITGLPPELTADILQAAGNADYFRLLELAATVSKQNPVAGERIKATAARYDYQKIVDMVKGGE